MVLNLNRNQKILIIGILGLSLFLLSAIVIFIVIKLKRPSIANVGETSKDEYKFSSNGKNTIGNNLGSLSEDDKRLEQERLEQERLEQERLEQERLEQERLEQERLEQERLEQE
ncbi:hypothetical protein DMUE_6171, partial [Dictyocoela muelleri]